MLFFISFFQNAQAYCGSEPIIDNLTCSSIHSGKIDFYQPSTLNNYYCDIHNLTLQENTCNNPNLPLFGYSCYWDSLNANCMCLDSYTGSYEVNYWLWDQSYSEDVYSFECQQTGNVTVLIDNMNCDLDLYILDSTCNPSSETACIQASDNYDILSDSVTFNCVQGQTYYIVLEGWGASDPNYGAYCSPLHGDYTLHFEIGANTGCTEDCADGNDNDGDGFVDCDDSDCLADPFCVNCDIDGDGFSNSDCGGSDCNDSDVSIYPTANEICDGIDQDCDGVIDDGAGSLFFIDADGDGYGNAAYAQQFCTPPPGYSALPGDCNDGMANMSPALQEICDSIDNDCNGIVDDGMGMVWYRDQDGDGFGSYNDTTFACVQPDGYTTQGGDCNDLEATVNANATEICDGLDNNCNSIIDEGLIQALYVDADGDGYGDTNQMQTGCSEGNGLSAVYGDCDDNNAQIYPTAQELCDNLDNDCNSLIDDGTLYTDFYLDADGDGHGNPDPTLTINACNTVDGYVLSSDDCDDSNSEISPSAIDIPYDGIDQDCDGNDLCDVDGDGFDDNGSVCGGDDCFDNAELIYPGATESINGIDDNCDGIVDESTVVFDDDNDGYTENAGDCDDSDSQSYPSALETCDGIDNNCNGIIDENTNCYDDDGDGFTEDDGDCNDNNSVVHPNAEENLINGLDDDCDGITDVSAVDSDNDGMSEEGGDCDDENPDIYNGAVEIIDGLDNDCDGIVDESTEISDDDGDGYSEVAGDCHDGEATIHPDAEETPDGRDNDCDGIVDNGMTNTDDDGDGMTEIAGDCDDSNPLVGLGMEEIFDGVDNDCDGEVDEGVYDIDQDGFSDIQGDCDDNNGWANPDMEEMCDGFDNDCNGEIDEIALCSEEGEDNLDANSPTDGTEKPPSGCSTIISGNSNSIPFEWLSLLLFIVPRNTRKSKQTTKKRYLEGK